MSDSSEVLSFKGRVAIVTGAGGTGMGREHAILLGARGATVIVNDLAQEAADATVKDIASAGGTAIAIAGSVAEVSTCDAIIKTAIDRYGHIDIVVNNAGIEITKDFDEFTPEDLDTMLGVHLVAAWNLTQEAWPHMKKQKYGRVLLVGSTSTYGMQKNAAYLAVKAGLMGLGRALAADGAEHGINVNVLGPTAATPMLKQMTPNEEMFKWFWNSYPAAATSAVVAWLIHEDCKTTGEMITSYGRGIGRLVLAETRGVEYSEDEEFSPEAVRKVFDGSS